MGKMQLKKVTQRLSSLKRLIKWENCCQRKLGRKKEKIKVFNIKNAKEHDYIWNKDIIIHINQYFESIYEMNNLMIQLIKND